jgi:hypothetical protein
MTAPNLATRVAVGTGLPVAVVERIFDRYNVTPQLSSAMPRPMRVRRLRIAGVRSVDPLGPFDSRIEFGPGLTVLAADNLRGKTSVLELLTWCLRGSPRSGLQGVVRSWLNRLDCDAVVAGRCLGFRLTLNGGDLVSARVLSAGDCDSLVDVDESRPDRGVVEILHATDDATFATMVESLMMELLNLERLESTSSRSESGRAVYGWPAYYGALYLPPGGEPALLGDAVMGGLPGRLLQVFLDLPSAALVTRMKAVRDQLAEAERAAEADADKLRLLLDEQRLSALAELEAARGEFAGAGPPASTADLMRTVSERTASAALAEASVGQARETFEILRGQRRRDEKRLNDVREHQAARLLFHALDPQVCPRCESPISRQRRDAERVHSICAVCTEPAVDTAADSQQHAAVQQEAQWRLLASSNAEQAGKAKYDEAAAYAKQQRQALADAERALAEARAKGARDPRRALIDRITRLEGAVAALESVRTPQAREDNDDVRTVLDAAVGLLTDEQAATSDDLFGELNAGIADLARSFGFRNLDRVAADRAGRLQVYKTGGPREWFRTQSPGERLRLRIAVIVALLRIGHRHGIATHPGLLMIDSPRSEEVQDDDAVALLTALEQLCVDMPGLQILVTTADETLVRETLTRSTIIAPAGPGQPLW